MSARRTLGSLLASALPLLSCRDASGPGDGGPLPIGRQVHGSLLDGDSEDKYTFRAEAGQELVVQIIADSGRFQFEVQPEPTPSVVLASASAVAPPDRPESGYGEGSAVAKLPAAGTYAVTVQRTRTVYAPIGGRYRLAAWWLDRRPEHTSDRFTIGQTVDGEQIDRPRDLDQFRFHGEQGQAVVLRAQETGGDLSLPAIRFEIWRDDVPDPVVGTPGLVGSLQLQSGDAALAEQASGRIVRPATGDYRVIVGGANYIYGRRFTGPYRFRVVPDA
jgi:hypothetical protein